MNRRIISILAIPLVAVFAAVMLFSSLHKLEIGSHTDHASGNCVFCIFSSGLSAEVPNIEVAHKLVIKDTVNNLSFVSKDLTRTERRVYSSRAPPFQI